MWIFSLLSATLIIIALECPVYGQRNNDNQTFISIEDDNCQGQSLTVAGLISKGKRVYQSSGHFNHPPENAVNGERQTVQLTGSGDSFLVVALLGIYRVNCANVAISQYMWKEHSLPLNVETRRFNSDWVPCGTIAGIPEYGKEYRISCHGVRASHVRLSKPGHLSLAEVEVFGEPVEMGFQLISRRKPAIQSSTFMNFKAYLAVDGKSQHICSHTMYEIHPLWQVNLKGEYRVTQ